MAKFYVLTEENMKTGSRPKTPREKNKTLRVVCFVLSAVIVLQQAALIYLAVKH